MKYSILHLYALTNISYITEKFLLRIHLSLSFSIRFVCSAVHCTWQVNTVVTTNPIDDNSGETIAALPWSSIHLSALYPVDSLYIVVYLIVEKYARSCTSLQRTGILTENYISHRKFGKNFLSVSINNAQPTSPVLSISVLSVFLLCGWPPRLSNEHADENKSDLLLWIRAKSYHLWISQITYRYMRYTRVMVFAIALLCP